MRILFTLSVSLLLCSLASAQEATRLTDLNAGAADASPTQFFNFQGSLLFRARGTDTGAELYLSNGTPEGTRLVKDINGDAAVSGGDSNPKNFIFFNGRAFFSAQNATSGEELYSTDGTTEGTVLVDDINPGAAASSPSDFVILNNELYFTASDAALGTELHQLDMNDNTARVVIDINPGAASGNPQYKTLYDGRFFFNGNDGSTGEELWASDGFDSGTFLIADLKTNGDSDSGPNQFTAHDGRLYFRADTEEFGRELYRTDGIATDRITDLLPGPGNGDPGFLTSFAGKLFFTGESAANGRELYVSDGTAAGTRMLELNEGAAGSSPSGFLAIDGPGNDDILVFIAEDEDAEQLFFLSIVEEEIEVQSMTEIYGSNYTIPTEPRDLVFTGSTLYFTGNTLENGKELYKLSLVTASGPVRITDIGAGAEDGGIDETTLISNKLFFEADDDNGKELWVLDAERADYELAAEGQGRINNGDTINMGMLNVGANLITRSFDIVSTGSGPNSADITNIDDIGDPFAVLPISSLDSIGAGSTANVQVGFLPTSAGTFVDSMEISIFGLNGPEAVTIYIKGVGVGSMGALDVTVNDFPLLGLDEISFGQVPSRTDSTIAVVLTNSGAGPLLYTPSLSIGSEFTADDLEAIRISPAGNDTIHITFAPDSEGAFTDTLTLNVALNAETMTEIQFVLTGNAIVNSVNSFGIEAVKAFPNPTADRLRVELGESLSRGRIRIFDVGGRQLREEAWPVNASMHELSIGALPAGAYTVEVSNGNRRVLLEVIKR